jgi:hypothetical protein
VKQLKYLATGIFGFKDQMSTLLLNADMQPVSLLPLSTVDWQEAVRYLVLDKVEVLMV